MSAKDKATNKERSIQVTASSGLSDGEVDRMVKEAETSRKDDDAKKELAEAKNTLDSLKYQVEKQLKEHGDKLDAEAKSELEAAIATATEALQSGEKAKLDAARADLEAKAHKLAEKVYQGQQAAGAEGAEGAAPPKNGDDDVIDAEFDTK